MHPFIIGLLIAALVLLVIVILLIAEKERFSEPDPPKEPEKEGKAPWDESDKYKDFSDGLLGI